MVSRIRALFFDKSHFFAIMASDFVSLFTKLNVEILEFPMSQNSE